MSNTNGNPENKTPNPENKTPNPGTKDALKAENEALKAELEALKAQVATAAANATPDEPHTVHVEERVEIFVEKGYANDEPNLIISVNGVMYLLPKGKTSVVPKFVADEYYRSRKAQQSLDETVEKLLAAASGK